MHRHRPVATSRPPAPAWSRRLLAAALGLLLSGAAGAAAVTVTDDAGRRVELPAPAARVISLAPHATELLYAAGAGHTLVAVGDYSDFPAAARRLPRVGSSAAIDYEAILALKPDLVIVWASGNGAQVIRRLERLGLRVFVTEPKALEAIADSIERLGVLAGSRQVAQPAAADFRRQLAELEARYGARSPVRAFYQVWNQPLMTVNGEHLISQILELCGGRNVFAELRGPLAPTVSLEAVLAADPEAILGSGADSGRPDWLDDWKRWPQLSAVKRGNLISIPPDLLQRHSPRVLEGARQVCEALDQVRERRPAG